MNNEEHKSGKLGAKLKNLFRPPYIYFIIGGLVFGIFVFLRSRSSSSTTSDTADTSSDTSTDTSSISDSLGSLSSAISTMAQNESDFESSISTQLAQNAQNQTSSMNSLVQSLTDVLNKSGQTTQQSTVDPTTRTTAMTQADIETANQITAAKSIQNLSNTWKQDAAEFGANPTKSQQDTLDALHNQANVIGIAAGFGDGGADGSKRIIPQNVKTAAGM